MSEKKLLLVDDSPENLQLLYQALKNEYDIYSTTSGSEALRLVESLQPDLILLDVMMPEVDGFEVCRILKSRETSRDIPVIFLTALTEDANEMKGFEAGGVDYITKPFKPLIVKQRIVTQLALKQQRDLLAKNNQELQEALAKIKVLSGIIPICMMCKKIRNDQGYWKQLEVYISEHSDALFSHGLCHECGEKQLKEFEAFSAPREPVREKR